MLLASDTEPVSEVVAVTVVLASVTGNALLGTADVVEVSTVAETADVVEVTTVVTTVPDPGVVAMVIVVVGFNLSP